MRQTWKLYNDNNRLKTAKESKDGLILFSNIQNDNDYRNPYMCVKRRGKWMWDAIANLSGPTLRKQRTKINDTFKKLYKELQKEINSHNVTKRKFQKEKNVATDAFVFMYNNMNNAKRNEFLNKFSGYKDIVNEKTCRVCNNITSRPFVKCRHEECSSMCVNCHSTWKSKNPIKNGMFIFGSAANCDTCPACNRSQDYTCPICYDDFKEEHIMKSDNCDHFICKNCFCNSFNSNPIVDCPMCRTQFKNTLSKTNYNDGAPEEAIIV